MATLAVPDIYTPALGELLDLPADKLEQLDQAILEAGADHQRTKAAFSAVLKHGEVGYEALISLAAARYAHNLSPAEVAGMVPSSVGSDRGSEATLQRLLGNKCIVHLAKRVDLASAFERRLQNFRIFTDIRPVFDDDPHLPIKAALVGHVVKVTYAENNEFKEVYFSADLDDLRSIQMQVERAIIKGETAEAFVKSAEATILGKSGASS